MILQALNAYYDRMSAQADDTLAPPGFSYQPISFEVVLDNTGKIVTVNDCRAVESKSNGSGKAKPRPSSMLVPQPPKRAGSAPAAAFLWDKTAFVFGMEAAGKDAVKAGAPPFTAEDAYFERFKAAHSILADSTDEGLLALHRFLQTWQPQDYAALQFAADMINTNVVFRLDFDDQHRHIHDRPAAKALWAAVRAKGNGAAATTGMCLVLGNQQPIARLHAAIKGVRGAQQAGGSIVSFNQDSFTSYGKDQGFNAPVSEQAAFAYTTALNKLLLRRSGQSVQIGDATTVYWAEAADPVEARHAEAVGDALFAQRATAPDDDGADADAKELNTLRRKAMERIEKGLPLDAPDLKLREGTRFYILGLAPNQARLSIRFWEATTLGALGRAFHQYWQELEIADPPRRGPPLQLWQVLSCTSPSRRGADGKPKYSTADVSPKLAGDFLRAVLNPERPYPATVLSTLVMRIRTDGHIDRRRAELLKACIVRTKRIAGTLADKEYLMRTDPNDSNPARRLGRLFAVLERAQICALGENLNSTIKDKYLGAAAATPAQVFVGLCKNSIHHTKRLKNGHSDASWIKDATAARRTGHALERDIGLLWKTFEDGLSPQHSINEQALFFVGYFQERYGGKPDPTIGKEPYVDANATPDNDDSTETSE
jgi:CRISPR-associated protein Csd1